jgi:hypothetical protein
MKDIRIGANNEKQNQLMRLYPKKHSTIASGATTIGSAEHAPNESYH